MTGAFDEAVADQPRQSVLPIGEKPPDRYERSVVAVSVWRSIPDLRRANQQFRNPIPQTTKAHGVDRGLSCSSAKGTNQATRTLWRLISSYRVLDGLNTAVSLTCGKRSRRCSLDLPRLHTFACSERGVYPKTRNVSNSARLVIIPTMQFCALGRM